MNIKAHFALSLTLGDILIPAGMRHLRIQRRRLSPMKLLTILALVASVLSYAGYQANEARDNFAMKMDARFAAIQQATE